MNAISRWFERKRLDRELAAEMAAHLQEKIDDLMENGQSEQQATLNARRRFGNITLQREKSREAWGWNGVEQLLQDLQFGARVLARAPAFSLLAVLTLALGLGASTAVFSVVNSILLKPLPFPEAEKIQMLWYSAPIGAGFGGDSIPWSKQQFQLFQAESKTFQHLGAFQADTFNFAGSGEPERFDGIRASAGFFPALGVNPLLGRLYSAAEDQPGHEREVVLSYRLWRNRFGGAPMLGRDIHLNGYAYSVIGIMPDGFAFPKAGEMPDILDLHGEPQLWVPLALPPMMRGASDLAVVGRLKPGISNGEARGELALFDKRLESLFPEGKGWFHCKAIPLTKQIVGDIRRPLLLMLGAVGLVLLIACSNVANLVITRSLGRTKEFTLRSALGAANRRLLQQLLTESLILAFAGGCGGLVLAQVALRFVRAFGPATIPRLSEVHIDLPVFLFAVVVTLATGVLFGLTPALSASSNHLAEGLREGIQRSGTSISGGRIRSGLLVAEVALALALVIAAGLLIRTLQTLLTLDSGFRAEHVLTFELSLPSSKYPDPDSMARLYSAVLPAIRSAQGVRNAGLISYLPMGGAPDSTQIRIPEHVVTDDKEFPYANYAFLSRDCLSALGTPLLRGRDFLDTDTLSSMPVAIVNRAMARKYWPGQNPIGRQVGVGSKKWPLRTIVGVVADFKQTSLRENVAPEMFVPFSQNEIKIWPSMQTMQAAVLPNDDTERVIRSVRAAIGSIDPSLPLGKVSTLSNMVADSLAQQRFAMLLLGSFAAMAMLLACIGLYGVVSYGVAQRTREIGIRIALGATRRDVFRMVLSQTGRLVGLGIAVGLGVALVVTRLMVSYLYGVRSSDPLTFAAVVLLLVGLAILASLVPARRAMRVDPAVALRPD